MPTCHHCCHSEEALRLKNLTPTLTYSPGLTHHVPLLDPLIAATKHYKITLYSGGVYIENKNGHG